MFTVNRKKGQKGFTLVEVIVVAVIVAALAAVAIPLYLSYVDSTRKNAAANAAGSVASFAGACRNTGGTIDLTGGTAAVTTGGVTTPGTPATGATCSVNGSTVQIPADIIIINTRPANATGPGRITGRHNLSAAADTSGYSY